MSEDNNLFMDEITGLRLLHSFRENMQSHSAGEREKEFPDAINQYNDIFLTNHLYYLTIDKK